MRLIPFCCAVILPMIFGSACSRVAADPMADFARELSADDNFPRIELVGRFDFSSASDGDTLAPMSASAFRGTIDLASRKCHFEFKDYRRKVLSASKPYETSDMTVVFDGEKWVVIRTPQDRAGIPWNINSFTEMTTKRPAMFLKTLDPLCFPIFGQLLDVTEDEKQVPLVEFLRNPKVGKREVEMSRRGNEATVTVRSGIATEKFLFDASKGNVLMRRDTDFNRYARPGEQMLRNELVVSEVVAVGDWWFPKTAVFRQFLGTKVTVERKFAVDEVKVVSEADPIVAAIPPYSLVTDDRRPDAPPWNSSESTAPIFNGK